MQKLEKTLFIQHLFLLIQKDAFNQFNLSKMFQLSAFLI